MELFRAIESRAQKLLEATPRNTASAVGHYPVGWGLGTFPALGWNFSLPILVSDQAPCKHHFCSLSYSADSVLKLPRTTEGFYGASVP